MCPYWQLKFRTSKFQDGGRPPSWKIEKWPYLDNVLTERHAYWPYQLSWSLKIEFLKYNMADGRHFENS